ncbi:hypothetical protein HanIR_Chr14g0699181 [Helianthus annuus]|nr:hypothetical protein HanIR_Chr14g0699181 [Helianthus annuus]
MWRKTPIGGALFTITTTHGLRIHCKDFCNNFVLNRMKLMRLTSPFYAISQIFKI